MSQRLQSDPQSSTDTRGLSLNFVGIDEFEMPLMIEGWDKSLGQQSVHAAISLGVSVKAEQRGIHMSRLVEWLHRWEHGFSLETLPSLAEAIAESQGADTSELILGFTWFVERSAPASEKRSWQSIRTHYMATIDRATGSGSIGYRIAVPVTTLCPCSREISDYGAHSQRGWINGEFEWQLEDGATPDLLLPGESLAILETCGSAPIYPLLKRLDERQVTMQAYENPAFVEDVARQCALRLGAEPRVDAFRIEVRNEESIHTHNAVARVEGNR